MRSQETASPLSEIVPAFCTSVPFLSGGETSSYPRGSAANALAGDAASTTQAAARLARQWRLVPVIRSPLLTASEQSGTQPKTPRSTRLLGAARMPSAALDRSWSRRPSTGIDLSRRIQTGGTASSRAMLRQGATCPQKGQNPSPSPIYFASLTESATATPLQRRLRSIADHRTPVEGHAAKERAPGPPPPDKASRPSASRASPERPQRRTDADGPPRRDPWRAPTSLTNIYLFVRLFYGRISPGSVDKGGARLGESASVSCSRPVSRRSCRHLAELASFPTALLLPIRRQEMTQK